MANSMADSLDVAPEVVVRTDHSADNSVDTGAGRTKSRWLFVAIAIVSWSCWCFPEKPLHTRYVDPSWQAVLSYAGEMKMQFGHDIVFTYGPLGYLSGDCFSPYAPVTRLFFEVIFGVVIATGLCLLAWRITWPWRLVLLGFFIFLTTPLHWNGDALYADLGLFAWGLLCYLESGSRLRSYVLALAGFAVVAALIKFTFLILGVLTIGLVACDLILRRRHALAAGMIGGFILGFLILWKLLGQNFSGLGSYLTTSFDLTQDYNAVMGLTHFDITWLLLIAASAAVAVLGRVIISPIAGRAPIGLARIPLLLWLAGILFEEWKYGCVRSDWPHVKAMLGILPIMVIGMESLPAPGKRSLRFARGGILVCLAVVIIFLQVWVGIWAPVTCITLACRNLAGSIDVLVRPVHYLRVQTEFSSAELHKDELPHIRAAVGDATADVFGQYQIYAIFNSLNYWPRPVFQSYTAYSRRTMALNEEFYSSSSAPQYVLFNLRPIDQRFPPLEDAFVLRDLLMNYGPVFSEGDYLLLRQKSIRHVPLTLVHEGTARLGEKVNLPDDQKGLLWLEVKFQPKALDRLRAFLYRPEDMRLVIWKPSDHEPSLIFNAPTAMLSAGFLINPLALDNQAVVNIYSGTNALRAGAFTVETTPDLFNSGQSSFQYRLFQIER